MSADKFNIHIEGKNKFLPWNSDLNINNNCMGNDSSYADSTRQARIDFNIKSNRENVSWRTYKLTLNRSVSKINCDLQLS